MAVASGRIRTLFTAIIIGPKLPSPLAVDLATGPGSRHEMASSRERFHEQHEDRFMVRIKISIFVPLLPT